MTRRIRKKKHRKQNDTVVGVAWYRLEQWTRLLEISADRADLEDSYEEWEAVAQDSLQQLARQNIRAEKVDIDVEELLAWCTLQGRAVDAQSRTHYTAEKLRQLHEADT